MGQNYTLWDELKSAMYGKRAIVILLGVVIFFLVHMINKDNYGFRDELGVFTFHLDNILPIVFPLLAVLVYLSKFASELHHRFILYTRARIPIKKMLLIKCSANAIISFSVFFLLVFSSFIFAFYIEPLLQTVQYSDPANYGMTKEEMVQNRNTRHTFTQLLVYGDFVYGLFYSLWVGLHAAIWATIGFFLLLMIERPYVAMAIPYIVYFVQMFLFIEPHLRPFRLSFTMFPFGFTQQPIWTAFVPMVGLLLICGGLFLYVYLNFRRLDQLL
ncbi:hypothetical protein G4V62_15110 [Bacillaceae bacterium SIJ1]|uniref:hypothetical protein n=1 Tax=Litoribacterium kuwaitense TaxID=1398745 RepID=UPI0013EB2AE5|nr:hypothetical protein [Litoribacterium kuwaitense]NGP46216.1 hypothetical protein [Litoribacterium kuwaitense]